MARIVDRDAKRLKILEAAGARFARSGYEATSMDDLASAAGVSKGSLYDYFRNKEDLFYGVFEWLQQVLMQASLERVRDGTTAHERIGGFAEATIGAFVEHVALYPVMLEVWAAAAKTDTRERFAEAMRNVYVAYRAEVTQLLLDGQERGEIDRSRDAATIAGMLIGAVDGLMLQYWLDPSFDPGRWAREFIDGLFGGIGIKQTGSS